MRRLAATALLVGLFTVLAFPLVHAFNNDNATARITGEVFANGRQMHYLSMLSDGIGSRLTGTAGARRAVDVMEAEMKRIGLSNVHREPFKMPVSWERGTAQAWLTSHNNRPLTLASYTWTPGTEGAIEGDIIEVGAGRPEDVERVRAKLKGAVVLAAPAGETLDYACRSGEAFWPPALW